MSNYKNWPVPHNARLEKAMEPGQMVSLKGTVFDINLKENEDADPRIVVNLSSSGNGDNANDIPLHISIRFKHKEIVLNSKLGGDWGKEEKKKLPFQLGGSFDLRLRAHADKYELLVDGKDFATYEHRAPLADVNHVFIDGPLNLYGVSWGGKYYSVPFETQIQGGLGTGKRLHITATPEKKAERFNINLVTGNGDIALHVNPRFKEDKVVRNSCKDGEWANEEREGGFPFKRDITFDMVLVNESYSFQVIVNDEPLCSFAHRMEPNSIVGVQVQGEVELHSIMII